ncbi:MAG: DUF2188 domain-containing protein [Leeuwenhoekiella sp.]
MKTVERNTLNKKFEEAGSSGTKGHIVPLRGKWVVFREGTGEIFSRFSDRKSAIDFGRRILDSGRIEALVFHKANGSVERIQFVA